VFFVVFLQQIRCGRYLNYRSTKYIWQTILPKHKERTMASKLMIIKQTRPSLDVEFYTSTADTKAQMRAELLPIVSGERNIASGMKKLRTVLFTNEQCYTDWQESALMQEVVAARDAHNTANGIISEIHMVDLPGYNPFKV
jgi:hypothetical protein